MDIRFARTINRIQQSIIQELNKIAIIHLFILGFKDELGNFKLVLTNPSTQGEMLKVEQWKEKVMLYKDLVGSIDGGLAPTSHTWAKKNIFNWSEDEILQDLQQQRLERAAAKELEATEQVIKKTGLFDKVDKLYGEIDTGEEKPAGDVEEGGDAGGDAFGGGGGDSFGGGGGGFDFGGGDAGGDAFGGEETVDTGGEEAGGDAGGFGEAFNRQVDIDKLLLEGIKRNQDILSMTKGITNLIEENKLSKKTIDDDDIDLIEH